MALSSMLNGAPIPNWAKLLVLGAVLGTIIGLNQSSVETLKRGQAETRDAIIELRADIRDRLVSRHELEMIQQRVESQSRRIEELEHRTSNKVRP